MKKGRTGKRSTEDEQVIDRTMGENLRRARVVKGYSQSELGQLAGISFQQIQKYEKGLNRISISRLYVLCGALECEPMDILPAYDNAATVTNGTPHLSNEALRLAADFDRIKDPATREAYRGFCRSLSL